MQRCFNVVVAVLRRRCCNVVFLLRPACIIIVTCWTTELLVFMCSDSDVYKLNKNVEGVYRIFYIMLVLVGICQTDINGGINHAEVLTNMWIYLYPDTLFYIYFCPKLYNIVTSVVKVVVSWPDNWIMIRYQYCAVIFLSGKKNIMLQ